MNAIITAENAQVSSQTLEDVLANGDLSKLTPEQRVAYYFQVCKSLGLNPYTRPFDYITLNGKRVLYAKRDCTDQLRQIRNITLTVTDKHIEDDLFIVTVRATDAKGRSDEDFGAVPITGLKGEPRANAILKGITKAKRRVTLSICGLGMNDESEVATIPGAVTEELELPPPPAEKLAPLRAVAADAKRVERKVDPTVYEAPEAQPERMSWAQWAESLELTDREAKTNAEVGRALARAEVKEIKRLAEAGPYHPTKDRILTAIRNLEERYLANPPEPDLSDEALGEVEIEGAKKVAAG